MTVTLPASAAAAIATGGRQLPQVERWRLQAACRGAPPDLFITGGDDDDDPVNAPAEARSYCDICPVRAECLAWALDHTTSSQRVVGIWGGLTEYQRDQLRRKRERAHCPDCASAMIVREPTRELCLACGLSWLTW